MSLALRFVVRCHVDVARHAEIADLAHEVDAEHAVAAGEIAVDELKLNELID